VPCCYFPFKYTTYLTYPPHSGRTPFDPEEEAAILKLVRKKTVWPCFVSTAFSFGQKGFRAVGFHEKSIRGPGQHTMGPLPSQRTALAKKKQMRQLQRRPSPTKQQLQLFRHQQKRMARRAPPPSAAMDELSAMACRVSLSNYLPNYEDYIPGSPSPFAMTAAAAPFGGQFAMPPPQQYTMRPLQK
jgi:hypothetical protein